MSDLPLPGYAAARIAALAALRRSGPVAADERLCEGVYISWDTEDGAVALEAACGDGALLRLDAQVSQAPRWFALNIDLGPAPLAPGDVLAVALDLGGAGALTRPPFLRSGHDGQRSDTALGEDPATDGPQVRLLDIGQDSPLTLPGAFHTLVLPLPAADFALTLRGARVAVLPAAAGLQAGPVTLGSVGQRPG